MTRQFFASRVCVTIALISLAIFVLSGLGWVSVTSLRLEEAQRQSADDAAATNQERLALWRLDSHMISPLGLENNRPYSHYSALHAPSAIVIDETGSPAVDPGRVPSPLLDAELPNWVLIHVQLDAKSGWQSPQVLSTELAQRLKTGPLGLSLANCTPTRSLTLERLRSHFPTRSALKRLAEQDRIEPSEDSYLVPVPLADEPSTEKPVPHAGDETGVGRECGESWLVAEAADEHRSRFTAQLGGVPRYAFFCELPSEKETVKLESKKDSDNPVPGDYVFPPLPMELSVPLQVAPKPRELTPAEVERDALPRKLAVDKVAGSRGGYDLGKNAAPAPGATNPGKPTPPAEPVPELEKQTIQWIENMTRSIQNRAKDETFKNQNGSPQPGEVKPMAKRSERTLAPAGPGVPGGGGRGFGEGRTKSKQSIPADFAECKTAASVEQGFANSELADAKTGPIVVPVPVHLGPMRARWLTDETGVERLFLLRSVRLGMRIVYQGLAVDWPELRSALLAEIADLFPDAELSPALQTEITAPERTMTALPVRLETNRALPAPVGTWSPLRFGLVIAWLAALLAIAGVAFGARAILSMSERRIRFASAVTHELRTPLTAMQLHLDLLNSGLVTDESKRSEFLATVSTEAQRLNQLVENVLDFSRLEKRSARGTAQRVAVEAARSTLVRTWADRLAGEGYELTAENRASVRAEVRIDPRVLDQILGNLIDNARKYSQSASDRRIWLTILPAGVDRLAFEVEDRGPGVAEAERRRIFQPFERGSSSTDTGGTGLGLALAKQWAELFGGTLSYRPAADGVGACFRLELPARSG